MLCLIVLSSSVCLLRLTLLAVAECSLVEYFLETRKRVVLALLSQTLVATLPMSSPAPFSEKLYLCFVLYYCFRTVLLCSPGWPDDFDPLILFPLTPKSMAFNLWGGTPLGVKDPFTEVTQDTKHRYLLYDS